LEHKIERQNETIMQLREDLDTRAAICIGEVERLEGKMCVKDGKIEGLEKTISALVQTVERLEQIIHLKDAEIEDLTL
jgi:uncharacterized small protein (DUF1192 family)